MQGRNRFPVLICCFITLWSGLAIASDGVLEINQACAVNGGCFSGDTAGYPVTLDGSAGGSYLLTSNLVVPNENTHGIEVTAPAISIDLNGFEIRRSGCDEIALNLACRPSTGTGSGIVALQSSYRGISVSNGSIVGMGDTGVDARGDYSEVKNMRVRFNRNGGIRTGFHAIVTGNILFYNGGDGIRTTVGAMIKGNVVRDSAGDGIEAGYGSNVRENVSIMNGGKGIYGVSTGLIIVGNTAHNNTGDGIYTFGDSNVLDNSVRLNTGYGLNLSADAAYRGNVIAENTAGTVNGGFNMGDNFCNTNDVCP